MNKKALSVIVVAALVAASLIQFFADKTITEKTNELISTGASEESVKAWFAELDSIPYDSSTVDEITASEVALLDYAHEAGYRRTVIEEWESNRRNWYSFSIKEFMSNSYLDLLPSKVHHIRGEAFYHGWDVQKNDLLALREYVLAFLNGHETAFAYMYGLYIEYECDQNAMSLKFLGLKTLPRELRYHHNFDDHSFNDMKALDKVTSNKKALVLSELIGSGIELKEYPFSMNCVLDAEVMKLIGGNSNASL